MQPTFKKSLRFVLALTLALPIAVLLTLLLLPFWTWLESAFGIESIGHSGPAGWCYVASFALTAAIGGSLALRS